MRVCKDRDTIFHVREKLEYVIDQYFSGVKVNFFIKKTREHHYRNRERKLRYHLILKFSIHLKLLLLPKSPIRRHACTFLFLQTKVNFMKFQSPQRLQHQGDLCGNPNS